MPISAGRSLFLQCNCGRKDSNEGQHAVVVGGGCGVLALCLCTHNRWSVLTQEKPCYVELTIGRAAVTVAVGMGRSSRRSRSRGRGVGTSLSRGSSGLSNRGGA